MTEMSPAEEIFFAALEKADPAEREAYLDAACADQPELRNRVSRLLEAHPRIGEFLRSAPEVLATVDHTPAPTASVRSPTIVEGPGTTIGSYKLLQQIGEGGMGVVFMAEQTHPVRRKVALKVIKPGMDTGQVVARFEAERQALAMMDHPNIARVLDVGATETGRPFFVMELVKGVPITEYCDRNQLTPKERLELFMPVCRAIQHAHQKGIIHRDIKPSNVLVTLHDGQAVPKVIDFGVAKAVDQRLTERTMFTEFGAVIGTLEYMSPEQAEMGALDIDTRSDIYSLGVLLYELLTGSTPLERAKLRKAAYTEVLRRIREEEPAKPSTRLSESNDTLPSISAQRRMEPARLTKLVRGDLDWIVMKSLEKDRTRRYETATGFARDIQRYLEGDAVEACPPSASYRLRKFARKHRAALATTGAFALVLIAATAISIGLAYWANRERERAVVAEKLAEEQRKRAEAALSATEEQRKRAQANEEQAIEAVKKFGDVIAKEPELKNDPKLQELRKRLMKEPLGFFKSLRDRLQADKETTPEALAKLASVSFDLGDLTYQIGDTEDALRAFQDSRILRERLIRENPANVAFRSDLASTLHNSGIIQHETGREEEASTSQEQALAILERLVWENPSIVEIRKELGRTQISLGIFKRDTGRLDEALALFKQSLEIFERLAREKPAIADFHDELAYSHLEIGRILLSNMGRPAEARAFLEKAREIFERLARENPAVTLYQSDLAWSHYQIGLMMDEMGRPAEALASSQKALEILERLAHENPSLTYLRRDLAQNYNESGRLIQRMGRLDEARISYEKALAIRERLARENPSMTIYLVGLAQSHNNIGTVKEAAGQLDEALASYEKAREIREGLVLKSPFVAPYRSSVALSYNNIGFIRQKMGRTVEALTLFEKARAIGERLAREIPQTPYYRQQLIRSLNGLAQAEEALNHADEAARARREIANLNANDPAKAALDARLAAVLAGQKPVDEAERIQLAFRAYEKFRYTMSARLYAEALANDPKLADDRKAEHAYNGACASILAATGQGKDEAVSDEAARARLRSQALDCLRAELAAWAKALGAGTAEAKMAVAALCHWKEDSDLIGIRDEKELAKLPQAEREAFRQLWADVERLLATPIHP